MLRETAMPVVVAALLVLAGCAGASGPTLGDTNGSQGDSGSVNFYISDERNAIDDFEHLNVTITQVGFRAADGDDDDEEDAAANETEDADETNETATDDGDGTETSDPTDVTDDRYTEANETVEAPDPTEGPEEPETDETTEGEETDSEDDQETESESESEDERESDDEDANESEDDGRVVRQVDDITVDLTQYQGANATLLTQFEVPNGTYTKAFVYIGDINATLENGEHVNVKLPSNKLQLNQEFTVGNGEEVDFVFDITVFKAGNSGKYILKPVVSESGTDVPIEAPGREDDEREGENENEEGESEDGERGPPGEDEAGDLTLDVAGPVETGESVTLAVERGGEAVAGAQVFVDGQRLGETGADGRLEVAVPEDAAALEVTVRLRGEEVETTVMVEDSSGTDATTTAA